MKDGDIFVSDAETICICGRAVLAKLQPEPVILHLLPTCRLWEETADPGEFLEKIRKAKAN